MLLKSELEVVIEMVKPEQLLEIEFTSNNKSLVDITEKGLCYYAPTTTFITNNRIDNLEVLTLEIKILDNCVILKNKYTKKLDSNAKQETIIVKVIPLDQILNITLI